MDAALRSKHVMLHLPRIKSPHDAISISVFITKTAMFVLTALTSIFSFLAAIDAESAKCAGITWVAGYRTGLSYFLGFPMMSMLGVALMMTVMETEKLRKVIPLYDLEIFRFRSLRITLGAASVYAALAGVPVWFGAQTAFSAARYYAIAEYCRSAVVLN